MIIRIIGTVAAIAIFYAGTLQLVYDNKREDGEPPATAWVHFWAGWMPYSWSESIANQLNENFLDDRRRKRRLEERKMKG